MSVEKDLYLFHEGTNYQAYKLFSPQRVNDGFIFRVWAPHAVSVRVVGDFNGWNSNANYMANIGNGVWEAYVVGAKCFDIYKYFIETSDGKIIEKADPFAAHTETSPSNGSKLFTSSFKWSDKKFLDAHAKINPYESPMNIYEMHLGSWRRHQDGNVMDYKTIADDLAKYVKDMGYTHVEILPITEYPFDGSWGYQTLGLFAPTSRYGTPDDFRYFVNRLHEEGIAVILDWVISHFPKDSHGLIEFDGKRLYEYDDDLKFEHKEWGTRVFDYAKPEVKSFLISSANYWFKEFHIDGIRVDAVASMLYLDYGRKQGEWRPNIGGGNYNLEAIDFLKQLNEAVLTDNPGKVMIAEESTAFPMITKPPFMGGLGFNFKWNMGWMNDTLKYFSSDPYFRKDMHDKLTFSITYAFSENYVLPISHDEVVHGKCSLINKMPGYYSDKFALDKAFMGYMMTHPGKKLLFMGSEFAQFIEWNYKQELDWLLLSYDAHKQFKDFVKDLNHYYLRHSELYEQDSTYDGFKWVIVNDNSHNIVAYKRYNKSGDYTLVVLNLSPMNRDNYYVGVSENKTYSVVLTSDDKKYGGTGMVKKSYKPIKGYMHDEAQYISISIPANSVILLKPKKEKEEK